MRLLTLILIGILFHSCRNTTGTGETEQTVPDIEPEVKRNSEAFTSQKWHFSAEIPHWFKTYEGQLPGESPVINFYDSGISEEPPFGVHNDARNAYISVLPEGFGVDAPGGPRKTFEDWEGNLPISFGVNPAKSYVYLLENGEPWALSLGFKAPPPPGWNEYGRIYVFYEVNNFRGECFSSNTGVKISMEECNPLQGDSMKFYGEISEEKRAALNDILKSLYFIDPNKEREEIQDLIKVKQPQEQAKVSSPLKISGEAKGYWFFEATAPVALIDQTGKIISEKYITATENWMTEGLVPFEAELEFETKEKRGYLIFNRANASGKPEHDRVLHIPVLFN